MCIPVDGVDDLEVNRSDRIAAVIENPLALDFCDGIHWTSHSAQESFDFLLIG